MNDEEDILEIKRQKSVVLDRDIITKLFRGKFRSFIAYNGADGQSKCKEKIIETFAAIMIRVIGFKDLYTAWEEQIVDEINDYVDQDDDNSKKEEKVPVQAIQSEYLELAPKVLCLQLNRLEFNSLEPIKHKHKVEIEKQITLDRFMLENKEKNKKIREQVKVMRE